MATRASKTILQGCRLLELMAAAPREPRTIASLVDATAGEMSPAQVEAALLAYTELGMISQRTIPGGATYWLLGAWHLNLALQELNGLLHDAAYLSETLTKLNSLHALHGLLTLKR